MKKTTKTKTYYEHRLMDRVEIDEWAGKKYYLETGRVLKKTTTPKKFERYDDHYHIPTDKVEVFKVTKTVTTELEEKRVG